MRYVESRWKEKRREEAYRIYVTDSLYYFNQNKALSARYADIIDDTPADPRSAEEIIVNMKSKLKDMEDST